jgi:hypothetical protein
MSPSVGHAAAAKVAPTREAAEAAVARMREMSADLRGCAVLDADLAGGERAESLHVGTEDGEVFAVHHGDLAMVAVSERFTLASLMLFDMRTVLREMAGGGA